MSPDMEAPPAPPQPLPPQAQQLPSPCESPKPTHDCLETSDLCGPTDKSELSGDCIPPGEEHDTPDSLFQLIAPVEETLRTESSLFVDDNAMEGSQVAEDNFATVDSFAMEVDHTLENHYAMEGIHAVEKDQQIPHAHEAEVDSEDDTLPSIEKIFDGKMAMIPLEEFDCDGNRVTEEDEASEYENGSNSSSDSDCEHEVPQAHSASTTEKASKKPRRKIASTAREYVARLHEEEDRKNARKLKQEEGKKPGAKRSRKRKLVEGNTGSSKALKTANGSSILISNDCSLSSNDRPLLPMEPIKARTHAEQFAQLTASIPQNCDIRRKTTQKQDLKEAAKLFGYKKVEAQDGDWKLKGMETAMRNHQITAAAWMVKRELARMEPFGGILADAMGMGKTIMSLACIIGNPPDDEHISKFCKATLVVVPSKTIALQWEEEARKHYSEPYNHMVFVYDRNRPSLYERCTKSFIVIVTYKELISQYPDKIVLKKLYEKYTTDDISFQRELDKIVGTLFRVNWYRIILDEAHAIKNAESRTTTACCALFGKYRWALSGTPLANSSDEMYPYMKFTQCEWTLTHKEFRSMFFVGDKPNAQFEALTSLIMYRRTIDDDFLGRQIISIPERKETELWIPASMEEQFIVDAVTEHYTNLKARTELGLLGLRDLEENDAEILEIMEDVDDAEEQQAIKTRRRKSTAAYLLGRTSQLRQRQSTSHVFCIEPLLRQKFSTEELDKLSCTLEEIDTKRTILEQMQLGIEGDDEILKYQKGLQMLQEREETFFGKYFEMEQLLNILGGESRVRGITCLICNEAKPPLEPVFSPPCQHIFCFKCICTAQKGDARGGKTSICPHEGCNEELRVGDDVQTMQKIMEKAEEKGSGYREPAKDSLNVSVRQDDNRNGFFVASTFCKEIPILPSTKLTAAVAVILTWMHEAPDDKILVFTQFTGALKMLGLMLQTLNIGFVYYYGGLSPSQKSKALDTIGTKDDIKVMISTLKCGGQSLNLTVANRVIIIDPWWNKTAEQQAFGRVVRIGQEKVTHLVNIKTKEPIDYRIYSLQEKKAKDVDRTLQDDGHEPLPVNEIELKKAFMHKKCEKDEKKAAKAKAAKMMAKKTAAKSAKKNSF